jgi:hypothetical protein
VYEERNNQRNQMDQEPSDECLSRELGPFRVPLNDKCQDRKIPTVDEFGKKDSEKDRQRSRSCLNSIVRLERIHQCYQGKDQKQWNKYI